MEMDVRDLALWYREAQVQKMSRRMEAYAASLLPHQEATYIRSQVDDLKNRIFSLENEEEIENVEKMAQRRLQEIRGMRRKKVK